LGLLQNGLAKYGILAEELKETFSNEVAFLHGRHLSFIFVKF
jgi:hypothetical protein